ncbi:MAG TPA: YciI family protein [Gemmatimonadaceae bacterium]|nr:YciI family protein [Gemmatimonadaceae bacterium]
MKYLCLIYDDEAKMAKLTKQETDRLMADYGSFTSDVQTNGRFVAAERLQPVSTASTVRVRDGKISTTDGPYAETREQLGGFYLIEGKDLNDAIQTASRIPSARIGAIEVRPVWQM